MRTVKVTLNGQEFEIQELRSRANAAWRKKLEQPFTDLATLLKSGPEINLVDGEQLAGIVEAVSGLLIGSFEIVLKLLIEYAPQLEAVREEVYDSELLDVFGSVLGLAYPFGGIFDKLIQIGRKEAKAPAKAAKPADSTPAKA